MDTDHRTTDRNDDADTAAARSGIERDIDRTRERISRRVDELEQRLSPQQLADQALGYLRTHGNDAASQAMNRVLAHPLPILTIGAGVLWLLAASSDRSRAGDGRGAERSRTAGRSMADRAGARASALADRAQTGASALADRVRAGASSMADRVQSGASAMADKLQEGVTTMTDKLQDGVTATADTVRHGAAARTGRDGDGSAPYAGRDHDGLDRGGDGNGHWAAGARQQAEQWRDGASRRFDQARDEVTALLEEQPIVAGAVGIAIGAALGSLLPVSRPERDVLGHLAEPVVDGTRHWAAEGYESARDQARQTVDALSSRIGPVETPADAGPAR